MLKVKRIVWAVAVVVVLIVRVAREVEDCSRNTITGLSKLEGGSTNAQFT